jgi:hypothetical protein
MEQAPPRLSDRAMEVRNLKYVPVQLPRTHRQVWSAFKPLFRIRSECYLSCSWIDPCTSSKVCFNGGEIRERVGLRRKRSCGMTFAVVPVHSLPLT